jgi:hypothetical protein
MQLLKDYFNLSPEFFDRLVPTLIIFILLSAGKLFCDLIIKKRTSDVKVAYRWRRAGLYTYTILLILLIGPIWTRGITSLTTFLGLASAGIAVAMHDTYKVKKANFYEKKPHTSFHRILVDLHQRDITDPEHSNGTGYNETMVND